MLRFFPSTVARRNRLLPRHFRYSKSVSGRRGRLEAGFGELRVFVSNIPDTVDWKELKDHCRKSLPGVSIGFCSISKDMTTGESKGHGLVQFDNVDDTPNAIEVLNGSTLRGSILYVRKDVQESQRRKK